MNPKDRRSERLAAVEALLNFEIPLEASAQRLKTFDWDYPGIGVTLRPSHVAAILRRFLSGEISAAVVEGWADMIECREDVDILGGAEAWTGRILHKLADPVLFSPLSHEQAQMFLKRLDTIDS